MTTPNLIQETLRSLRVKFGYTQEEAAELYGVTVKKLRVLEKDSSKATYPLIKKIESVYGVSQDQIFFGSEVTFSEHLRSRLIS